MSTTFSASSAAAASTRCDGLDATSTELAVDTPFGAPSDAIVQRHLGDTDAPLPAAPRPRARVPPHGINYRANVCALKKLGATHLVQRQRGRLDEGGDRAGRSRRRRSVHRSHEEAHHDVLRRRRRRPRRRSPIRSARSLATALGDAGAQTGARVHRGGTYVCIEGPQFSTRAESRALPLVGRLGHRHDVDARGEARARGRAPVRDARARDRLRLLARRATTT